MLPESPILVIAEILARCPSLRARAAAVTGSAQLRPDAADVAMLLWECSDLDDAAQLVRRDLVFGLMDAPTDELGHSRLQRVERVIDSLEASVRDARARLEKFS